TAPRVAARSRPATTPRGRPYFLIRLLLLGDDEDDQVVEEGDDVRFARGAERDEGVARGLGLTAVLEDRLGEGGGPPVVQVGRRRAHAPQVLGQPGRVAGADLVHLLGQTRPHVVALEVAVEANQGAAARGALLEGAE